MPGRFHLSSESSAKNEFELAFERALSVVIIMSKTALPKRKTEDKTKNQRRRKSFAHDSPTDKRSRQATIDELFSKQTNKRHVEVKCPACGVEVPRSSINDHLDLDCRLFDGSAERKLRSGNDTTADFVEIARTETDSNRDSGCSQETGTRCDALSPRVSRSDDDRVLVASTTSFEDRNEEEERKDVYKNATRWQTADVSECVDVELSETARLHGSSCEDVSVRLTRRPVLTERQRAFLNKIPSCFQDVRKQFRLSQESADHSSQASPYFSSDRGQTASDSRDTRLPYYVDNFLSIFKTVLEDPDDRILFDEDDLRVVQRLYTVSDPARALFVRIFSRKFRWIPVDKLNYEEIGQDLLHVCEELVEADLVEDERNLTDVGTALRLLRTNQMKNLLKTFKMKIQDTKSLSVDSLMKHCAEQRSLFSRSTVEETVRRGVVKELGKCFKLREEPRRVFLRVILLHSLSDTVDDARDEESAPPQLATYLMANIGKTSFPPYRVHRVRRLFETKTDLVEYETAYFLEGEILAAIEEKNFDKAVELCSNAERSFLELISEQKIIERDRSLPPFLRRFTRGHLLVRCANHGVDVLQKLRKYGKAIVQLDQLLNQNVYGQHYRGHWIERKALNLDQHVKQPHSALREILSALTAPDDRWRLTDDHRLALSQRARRIYNSQKSRVSIRKLFATIPLFTLPDAPKIEIEGRRCKKSVPGVKSTFLIEKFDTVVGEYTSEFVPVEEFALRHYLNNRGFADGLHGEGSAIVSVFCLLFWDMLYDSRVPDAFRGKQQSFPLDLISPEEEFYANRKSCLDEKLNWIRNSPIEDLLDLIARTWTNHHSQMSLCSWKLFQSCERIQSLARCIKQDSLACICERLIKNYRHFRGGFPDLTVWNSRSKQWKVIEVKGPGDSLSHKQIIWLNFLKSIRIPCEVCYVKNKIG